MTGVIAVDKPSGFTSFDVIAKMRGILKERRLGHSGTLDPMATGVLPVFIGSATKAADMLSDPEKRYEAGFALGRTTDTQDITGSVVKTSDIRVKREDIEAVLKEFTGEIMQLPPMYSAVKVDGKRLYDIARRGETAERKPRPVTVYKIALTGFDEAAQTGGISVFCSKGTYIRTIINDIGERLGTFACMSALRRTYSQGFKIEECSTLEKIGELSRCGRLDEIITPVDRCFADMPAVKLSEKQEKMYRCGVKLDLKRINGAPEKGRVRVYGAGFLGIASADAGELRSVKSFWGSECK